MKKFMQVGVVLLAVLAVAMLFVDNAVAKTHAITVVLVDHDGKPLMAEQFQSAVSLDRAFQLEPGSLNKGELRRGAVQQNIDGLVKNMKARLTMGSPLQQPGTDTEALSRQLDDNPNPGGGGSGGGGGGGGSQCLTLFVAPGTNEILCSSSCRNCYYEKVNP